MFVKLKMRLVFLLASALCIAEGARILMLAPVCSKSHRHGFMPIMQALAERGHQVTVITPYALDKRVPNLKEIKIESVLDDFDVDWFALTNLAPFQAIVNVLNQFTSINQFGYQRLMTNEEFRRILDSRDVDLVIVDAILNDFTMPIVDNLKVPFIFYCPAGSVPWLVDNMNAPQEYSYVPAGQGDKT